MATRNSKNDNNQTQRKSQRDQNSEVPFSIASISSITNILGHHRRRRTSSSSTGIDAQLDIHRIEQARAGGQRLPGIPGDQQPDGYRLSVIQDRSGAVSDRWRHRPPLLDRSRAAQGAEEIRQAVRYRRHRMRQDRLAADQRRDGMQSRWECRRQLPSAFDDVDADERKTFYVKAVFPCF